MAHVYVYDWDNDDYSTIGECGALDALSCTFEEVGGGMSEIALIHAVDALGKFKYLRPGAILKANVPVRTTPEIENGQFVTRVERWKVKESTTKKQRYVYSKKAGGRRTKTLKAGAEVIVTQKPEDAERWKIKSGKVSGWMASDALESSVEITLPDNASGIENAAPSWESREQLFRIYKVNKTDDSITCNARHIQYDLLQNLTSFNKDDAVTLQASGDAILNNCLDSHDFRFFTDISGTQPGAHYTDADPVTAFLDPDSGLLAAWDAQLVRDNFEIYMLGNAGLERGLRIEYAKNMLGVEMDEDTDSTATAILPMGEKKNGDTLYLPGDGLVLSPYADSYPFKRIYPLKCNDCTIGTNNVTEAIALARMREQAEEMFEQGADLPEISIKVTFANLGRSERYAQYRNLENVYLYDTVTVRNSRLEIDEKTQVIRIVWDCLNEKMQSVELGSLQALSPSVASWQISGGISGSKLINGSVGAAQINGDSISYRHMQVDSVGAKAVQAGSITTEKLAAGAITADKIQTGALDALTIDAVTAKIGKLTAQDITTDSLAAALAAFTVVTAGTAKFDKATVAHLVAEALNLNFGTAGTVFIQNLAVQYAQMVSAAIGDLCIKASDGNYYQIDVKADGTVSATRATVSAGEIAAGQTSGGKVILETNITAANLSTGNLLATYALVNRIDAARIDVDELFAREAFIDLLRTSKIIGDNSLEIIVRNADSSSRNFYQEDAPTSADYVRPGDTWTKPSSGEVWQAKDMSYIGLKFGLEGDLNFGYTLDVDDGSITLEVREDGCLYAKGIAFSVLEDGTMGVSYRWARVQDAELKGLANNAQNAADAAQSAADEAQSTADSAVNGASEAMNKANAALSQADFERVVRTDLEGLHVGDNLTDTEVLIDSASVNVVVGGVKASTFSDKFVRIDNMQVRKVRGGLAISVYKG